ncbi:MAG: type II 3-dehydroquinate dehydratase [Gammaproteobacteria bacterium]
MAHILFLNGPNLNLLGRREPTLYGHQSLSHIEATLRAKLTPPDRLSFFQSSYEGRLIDAIHNAAHEATDCIVINAGALTHTSIALRDALLGVQRPFIELHLSNVYRREPFRHHSYLADIAIGVMTGFGPYGYTLALDAALNVVANLATTEEKDRNTETDQHLSST